VQAGIIDEANLTNTPQGAVERFSRSNQKRLPTRGSGLRANASCLYPMHGVGTQKGIFMATNRGFSRSSLLAEQYQHEMELITVSLLEESQDEREERLSFVARSWSLTCACFQAQLESNDVPALVSSVAFVHR